MLWFRRAARTRAAGYFLAAALVFQAAGRSAQAAFTEQKFGGAWAGTDIALFDCNEDGRLDVVTTDNAAGAKAQVFRNDGGATPTWTSMSVPENLANHSLAVGDLDNDGDVDVVFAGLNLVKVWKGDGACGFTAGDSDTTAQATTSRIAVADLNNDGYLDLIFGESTAAAFTKLNKRDGTFLARASLHGFGIHAVKPADLNMDGRIDIVLGTGAAPHIIAYKNNADNTFTQANAFPALGNIGRSASVGDLDNDGDIDVAAEPSNTAAGLFAQVYRSTNPIGLGFPVTWKSTNAVAGESGYNSNSSYLTDFNNDGYRDLLLGQGRVAAAMTSKVYFTTTPAQGYELQLVTLSTFTRIVTAGDLNNDGRPDALLGATAASSGKSENIAYLATGPWGPREPPTPPTSGFSAQTHYGFLASGTTYTFYWGDGADPIAGSTAGYSVAIATHPMTEVTGLTSTTTWPSRLTVTNGGKFNVSPSYGTPFQPLLMTRTTDQLNRLIVILDSSATYYWRVATINTADKRSAWSSEQNTLSGKPTPAGLTIKAVHISSISAHWALTAAATGYTLAASVNDALPPAPIYASSTTEGNAVTTATVYTPALAANTTYYLFVRANHPNESSVYSAGVGTATLAALPLTAVSTFSAVTGDSFTVFWERNGNPLVITTYTVQLSTASNFNVWATSVTLTTAPASGPNASFTGLEGLTVYYLRVRAVNHNGVPTDYTALGSTTTLVKIPAGLQFQSIGANSVTASWLLTNGATGYTLAASVNAAVPPNPIFASSTTVGNAVTTATVLSPALDPNTTYYFFVRTNAPGISSDYSAALGTATLALAPATVVSTFTYVHSTSMTVAWSRNGNPISITTYTVVLSPQTPYPNANALNVALTSAPAGAGPSATFTGLNAGTTYYLFVRAVNHNEVPTAYTALSSTRTTVTARTWVGTGGNKNWHNAANWSPDGVPTATDALTIDLAQSVAVSASSPTAVFATLALGTPAGTAASNVTFSTAAHGGSVTIYGGAGLTQAMTSLLYFSGDFTMFSGSSLTHPSNGTGLTGVALSSVNIRVVGTFDLKAGATVQVSTMGYVGGTNAAGSGPGFGAVGTAALGGDGGGYGGAGGSGGPSGGTGGGAVYGSFGSPNAAGSGGGGVPLGSGGAGGGVVILDVGTMILNGRIEAYGGRGDDTTDTAGGGGSGGGVSVTAVNFSGAGTIDVHGGAGGNDSASAFDDSGGGGGGGRAAVAFSNSGSVCGLTIDISGGSRGTVLAGAVDGVMGSSTTTGSLGAPTNFSGAAQSASSIAWTWDLAAGATDYQVFASSGPMSPALGATNYYMTTGLAVNTTASFRVQARACGGNAALSGYVDAATLAAAPVTAVTTFTAVHFTSMTVAWSRNGNPVDVTSYTVVLTTSASYPNTDEGNVILTTAPAGSSLAATLTGLAEGTLYHLFIRAVNHAGTGTAYTDLGSDTTLASGGAASVNIIELTYDFESLALGVSSITAAAIAVVNDGSASETFSIRAATITTDSPWFLSTNGEAGVNAAVLQALFHTGRPTDANFETTNDLISDSYRLSQTVAGGGRFTVDDSTTGVSVPAGQSRSLWLRFVPPAISSTTAGQTIRVYVKGN